MQDDSEIVGLTPCLQSKISVIEEDYEINDELYYEHLLSTSMFKEKIVEYIGGFVVKRVLLKTDCDTCISSIKSTTQPLDSLITMRDYGNYLFYPSTFVVILLNAAEKEISSE